jgi:hypothetical protein
VDTAVRTLLAAGYNVIGADLGPQHIEIRCERVDVLGTPIPYLFVISSGESFSPEEITDFTEAARTDGRVLVLVARAPYATGHAWISWSSFVEALGGAVPVWRALTNEFDELINHAAWNQRPPNHVGEVWLLFEDLVRDGLEFVFGRRVVRLGGRSRGRTVSDMQAQTPGGHILVVDAKATGEGFDAGWAELRPLVEYVHRQVTRQVGHLPVRGAMVVSSDFQQSEQRLMQISARFLGETGVPLTFLGLDGFLAMINTFRVRSDLRNGVRWEQLFTGGRFSTVDFLAEVEAVGAERVRRGE